MGVSTGRKIRQQLEGNVDSREVLYLYFWLGNGTTCLYAAIRMIQFYKLLLNACLS